jgi:WD40 repeat protein
MSGRMPSPFVFLSHSGADADAARELKRRLESAPDAKKAGLKVWFDKDDLRPGTPWSAQIAKAIQTNATAFVVYAGSGGVMNWVEAEVDLAISRATTGKPNPLLFIPALAAESRSTALPPFAKRYQGVRDPLRDGEELAKLLKAVLNAEWDKSIKLIDEPFVGLRSMREEEADRFFGRDAEIKELVEKFRRHRIVAILADSGAGKSSLAEAGLVPAFRGGKLIDPMREDAREKIWHVVSMRPGADPTVGLRQGIESAASRIGRSIADIGTLRDSVSAADADKTAYALRCGLPPDTTSTLLIIDQFEELFTTTPDKDAADFTRLLLALATGRSDVRVLVTVRADYFNLASGITDAFGRPALYERLTTDNNDAILRIKAISAKGIMDAVCEPLKLAGERDEAANAALVEAVQSDISDQATDLPLMQVALRAAWQQHTATGRPMLECYQSVGRVSGALAKEADEARGRLPNEDQARLESIFVRLVRLGDTGGATRRSAALDEFGQPADPRRLLVQRIGEEEHGRLVVVGERTVELSHEALITQWPWLHNTLTTNAPDVRRLDRLMERAKEWREAQENRPSHLAMGAERELFDELAKRRSDWLSARDRAFVMASNEADQSERARWDQTLRLVRRNASLAITALADREAERRPMNAAKLALAAWPRDVNDTMTPKLEETLQVLIGVLPQLRLRKVLRHAANFVAFSPDGSLIASTFIQSNHVQIFHAGSGALVRTLKGHEGPVTSAAFNSDGKRIVTAATDNTARVWDAGSGEEIALLRGHTKELRSATFSPNGMLVATASEDGTARVWKVATGEEIVILSGHGSSVALDPNRGSIDVEGLTVRFAAFSPDGTNVVTASDDSLVRVWEVIAKRTEPTGVWSRFVMWLRKLVFGQNPDRKPVSHPAERMRMTHLGAVYSAVFSPDGQRILSASADRTARIWDRSSGGMLFTLGEHGGQVRWATFSPDGTYVITTADDKTVRLWESASGHEIGALRGFEETVSFVAFSPDGGQIVAASSNGIRLWDVWGGRVNILQEHTDRVSGAAFSPINMQVVTWSWDKTAQIWSANLDRPTALVGHDGPILFAAFSPDGTRVVTASQDRSARVWDAATGREIVVPMQHEGPVSYIAFSASATRLVTASEDRTAGIWDAATGHAILMLRGHSRPVVSAIFDLDGSRVVTASHDGTARTWDATNGREIAVMEGHEGEVLSAAYSPDGTRVVTASYDKTARIWDAA